MPRSTNTRSANSNRTLSSSSRNTLPNYDRYLQLDGVDDAGVTLNAVNMNNASKFTIFLTWKVTTSAAVDRILLEGSANFNTAQSLIVNLTSALAQSMFFGVHSGTGGSTYSSVRTQQFPLGSFVRLALTMDNGLVSGQAKVKANGSTIVFAVPNDNQVITNLANHLLYLGARGGASLFANAGIQDLFIITGKVATDVEQELWSNNNVMPTLGGGEALAGGWIFNQPSGNTVRAIGAGFGVIDFTLSGNPVWTAPGRQFRQPV